MKKNIAYVVLLLLSMCPMAQAQEAETAAADEPSAPETKIIEKVRNKSKIFTGFSGGMMLHIGYLFSDDPRKIFSNTGLGSDEYLQGLPKSGVCLGLGGTLRAHLINHIHLGAEGFVSTMPLMGTGSNVRTGWGGAMCDFYTQWGKVRPMIGITIGGGSMNRLYVPKQPENTAYHADTEGHYYNASYTKTPFFLLDPYVGLEVDLNSHMALLFRIDYMLPFGRSKSGLADLNQDIKWDNFLTPSGPRFYVGIMFGKLK